PTMELRPGAVHAQSVVHANISATTDGDYFMDKLEQWFNDAWHFVHMGFLGTSNSVLGLFIAIIAAFLLSSYKLRPVFGVVLGATLVHLVAQAVIPAVSAHGGKIAVPDVMANGYWRIVLGLFVGYFVLISVLFLVKKLVLKGGGGGGHH